MLNCFKRSLIPNEIPNLIGKNLSLSTSFPNLYLVNFTSLYIFLKHSVLSKNTSNELRTSSVLRLL